LEISELLLIAYIRLFEIIGKKITKPRYLGDIIDPAIKFPLNFRPTQKHLIGFTVLRKSILKELELRS